MLQKSVQVKTKLKANKFMSFAVSFSISRERLQLVSASRELFNSRILGDCGKITFVRVVHSKSVLWFKHCNQNTEGQSEPTDDRGSGITGRRRTNASHLQPRG